MLPEEFKQRIAGQKYIDSQALINALEEPSPVSIRINPSKWRRRPLGAENVPWCKNGYYLSARPSYTSDPLFHSGCYYPQEASGMFIEETFRQTVIPAGDIRVLDLCGAPGGKSTHLSQLIGPSGLLVANEVIRSRASILAETITKWGNGNTLVTQNDPSVIGKLTGYFDVILVDAPCSGEGMFRTRVAVKEWSVENAAHCSERQKRILMDVWPALKENGILIYSTCTFNPDENEENIRWLTGKHKAECLRMNIKAFPGITEIDYNGIFGYGFYPDKLKGEGLFITAIMKTESAPSRPPRSPRMDEIRPGKKETEVISGWTDFPEDRLIKTGDEITAIPCPVDDFRYLYQNLRIVKAGTKIAVRKNDDNLPSHELALSCHLNREAFPHEELDLTNAISYLRRDVISSQFKSRSWNIVTYNGVSLGFANNIGSRINNYFPVGWRIRLDVSGSFRPFPVTWEEETPGP